LQASKSLFQALGAKLEAALSGEVRPAVAKSASISISQKGVNGHSHQQSVHEDVSCCSALDSLCMAARINLLHGGWVGPSLLWSYCLCDKHLWHEESDSYAKTGITKASLALQESHNHAAAA
jgi:hypothetical protein